MDHRTSIQVQQKQAFEMRLAVNNGPDRAFDSWQLIDVHLIPSEILDGGEFDFWCFNGLDLYLLRIRKTVVERYSVMKSAGTESVIYLVAEVDFDLVTDSFLANVLSEFGRRGIPGFTEEKIQVIL